MNTSNPSIARYLAAQGLGAADLSLNRAGTVSPRQADIASRHRRRTTTAVLTGLGTFFLSALGAGPTLSKEMSDRSVFIAVAIASALAAILYGMYTALWRIPSLAGRRVELVEGRAEQVRYLATRDEFDLRVNGVRYKGFGRIDSAFEGACLRIYVVPDAKVVVGMEPTL